jgi:folate-binding protein YgfZ
MSVEEMVAGTRRGIGLFEMAHRGLLEVRGEDRVRWLDGMISGDVQALEKEGSGSGCYAVLLTNRGAIVADFHVGHVEDSYYLESLRSEIPRIRETLDRYIIADDVELIERSAEMVAIGLEGPGTAELLAEVAGVDAAGIKEDGWVRTSIAGRAVLIAAFGFTGEQAFQIRMKPEDREAILKALLDATGKDGIVRGSLEALEIMRVEAGLPALGAELDEEVLPPEARLERAISTTKGCYVGQEIVARLRARGQVNHLLVALRLESTGPSSAGDLPPVDAPLSSGGRVTGELTSVVRSPTEGPIGLGYVRREHSEIGTGVEFEGGRATVVELPFVVLARRGDQSAQSAGTTDTDRTASTGAAPRDSTDEKKSS